MKIYLVRIGMFTVRHISTQTSKHDEVACASWFWVIVLIVLLIVGSMEVNSSQLPEEEKTDHILAHINDQERESTVI
jgi:hypothetical protein